MARVNDADVKAILETTLDTTPFITAAHLIVQASLVDQVSALHLAVPAEPVLTEIERWLAAHLACVRDPRFREAGSEGDRMVFEVGQAGKGLQATTYGQQVLMLDTTGLLALVGTTTRPAIIKVN